METKARTRIRGLTWSRSTTIAARKYETISQAILASLGSEPITLTELVARVAAQVPGFDGSVSWYTVTCARELEVQGRITRQPRPVRYLLATAPPVDPARQPVRRRRVRQGSG